MMASLPRLRPTCLQGQVLQVLKYTCLWQMSQHARAAQPHNPRTASTPMPPPNPASMQPTNLFWPQLGDPAVVPVVPCACMPPFRVRTPHSAPTRAPHTHSGWPFPRLGPCGLSLSSRHSLLPYCTVTVRPVYPAHPQDAAALVESQEEASLPPPLLPAAHTHARWCGAAWNAPRPWWSRATPPLSSPQRTAASGTSHCPPRPPLRGRTTTAAPTNSGSSGGPACWPAAGTRAAAWTASAPTRRSRRRTRWRCARPPGTSSSRVGCDPPRTACVTPRYLGYITVHFLYVWGQLSRGRGTAG